MYLCVLNLSLNMLHVKVNWLQGFVLNLKVMIMW